MDRWILLHCVSRRLGPQEELSEREANARIQNWLQGPGARLEVDFVTVRRALIDEGFWDREDGGTRYRRARRHERRVRFADALAEEAEILAGCERSSGSGHAARGEPGDG